MKVFKISFLLLLLYSLAACVHSPEHSLSLTKERQKKFISLSGIANFSLHTAQKDLKFKGVLIIRKDLVYLEGLNPLGQPITYFLVDPNSASIYFPEEKILFQGETSAENIFKLFKLNLDFKELINILIANPLLDNLWQAGPGGPTKQVIRYNSQREKIIEVNYQNYQKNGQYYFPYNIDILLSKNKTRLKIYFKRAEMNNQVINLKEIKLTLPPDAKLKSLKELK